MLDDTPRDVSNYGSEVADDHDLQWPRPAGWDGVSGEAFRHDSGLQRCPRYARSMRQGIEGQTEARSPVPLIPTSRGQKSSKII